MLNLKLTAALFLLLFGLFKNEAYGMSLWDQVVKTEQVFLTVEYQGRYLNVWRQDSHGYSRFFVTPPCTIDIDSINCYRDEYSDVHRHIFSFNLKLWDLKAAEAVKDALKQKNISVPINDILPLPMQMVRINSAGKHLKVEIDNQWRSNQDQPHIMPFELYTRHEHFCNKMIHNAKTNTERFLRGVKLNFEFTMIVGHRATKNLNITGKTIQQSSFFAELMNKHADRNGIVYLQSKDMNRLAQDILNKIEIDEEVSTDYVSTEQEQQIINGLLDIFKEQQISSKYLTTDEWNSVFWDDIFARPDVTTDYLNEVLTYNETEKKFIYDSTKDLDFKDNIKTKLETFGKIDDFIKVGFVLYDIFKKDSGDKTKVTEQNVNNKQKRDTDTNENNQQNNEEEQNENNQQNDEEEQNENNQQNDEEEENEDKGKAAEGTGNQKEEEANGQNNDNEQTEQTEDDSKDKLLNINFQRKKNNESTYKNESENVIKRNEKHALKKDDFEKAIKKEGLNVKWTGQKFEKKDLLLYRINTRTLNASNEIYFKRVTLKEYRETKKIEIKASAPSGLTESYTDEDLRYSFHSQKMNYIDAEGFCRGLKGHLVTVNSMFENMFLNKKAGTAFTDSTSDTFWIGATDTINAGVWSWIDKSSLSFNNWVNGQALQNTSNSNCGAALIRGGKWMADSCDKLKAFVCEFNTSLPSSSTTTKSNPCPDTWIYYNVTGFCYKAIQPNTTWKNAEALCVKENAHLASIHSYRENLFITSLPLLTNNVITTLCRWDDQAWIGLSQENGTHFKWTDQTPFDYTSWSLGYPYTFGEHKCIPLWIGQTCHGPAKDWSVAATHLINNFSCDKIILNAICKRKPIT